MSSAAISAQNNFQGLILEGYIYIDIPPRRYGPGVHRWRFGSLVTALRTPTKLIDIEPG